MSVRRDIPSHPRSHSPLTISPNLLFPFFLPQHPFEVGGIYYTLSLLWSQLFSVLITYLLARAYLPAVLLCCGGWSVSFAAFLLWGIDRAHLGSFVDARTGGRFIIDAFQQAGEADDERRVETITTRKSYWRSIESEIKVWINERWGEWRETKPEWLTPSLITSIEDLGMLQSEDVSVLRQATSKQLRLMQILESSPAPPDSSRSSSQVSALTSSSRITPISSGSLLSSPT
jgi:hypothetical protein